MDTSPPPRPDLHPVQRRNRKAIWSLVLGILGIWPLLVVGPIIAISLGKQAKGEIAASAGVETGDGLATAGVVLGWVGLGLLIAGIAAFCAGGLAGGL